MKNITAFLDQIEKQHRSVACWVYSENDSYTEIDGGGILSISKLRSTLDHHLHIVVKPIESTSLDAHLLLPEISMVVPVQFINGKVSSFTDLNAA
ncbi:hypothetical protein L4D00_17860 [Photobacterium swingsii]|uniref:Uncharacterized protein n=1 Tax=Photobacterium swingsii TaxID=680026 RepID=A0A0J8VA52_9GAMM|nr:hypothetical protein [Photobacterium swingsii]KMV30027.1 hypothetical protein AB733_13945 [Photobacterium swingsii]PSW22949.1 hypothetical protein C9I94_17345 [Photobacterium swingsii]